MPLPSFHMIDGAPRPVAPFSHATEVDGWVFLTGQMPTDPAAPDAPLDDGVQAQTRRTMANLRIVLAGMGLGLEHVVQARVYLTHFDRDYASMNEIWPSFFERGKLPARTCIGVSGLAVGALVEIDMVARRP
jgi:2-iminobutanoate/2-iminopropanoate deaminase